MKIKEKYRSFYYATMDEVPEPRIDPKKTALLLVDLQNEFVLRDFGEALQFKAAGEWDRWVPFHDRLDDIVIPNNKKLLDFFRRNRMTVTYGRIACLREDGEDRSPVQKSEGWNGMLLPVNSYAAQIIDPLKPQENEIVVNKTTDSVTTGTNYLTLLQFMGIETVVVTGIVTDQCVACTVRGLADAGYKVICVVLVLPLCFIYAEMTSMMPYAGGQNIWVTNALGWNVGFGACWLVMLLYVMAMPTVAYGIASMVGYLVPIDALPTKIMAAVILVVWFFLSNKEMKLLARLQNILFWSTLAVSLAASLIFVFSGHWSFQTMEPIFPNGFSGYTAAVALLIMKFVGFDLIPQLSEEAKFPKKDLWKAFMGSLGCTVLIYGMAVVGVGGIVTTDWIINTDIVDPRVADLIGMHWLGVVIVIMGALTCITTLSSFWLSASRILYGAAKQHQMTRRFATLNRNGQPQTANIVVGILSIYFTVFAPDEWVNYIYAIYGLAAGCVYLLVAVSFLRLRSAHPEWPRPYRIKAGVLLGVLGVAFCAWVIYTSAIATDLGAWVVLIIYAALGVALWAYAKAMQKRDPANWAPVELSPDTVGRQEE